MNTFVFLFLFVAISQVCPDVNAQAPRGGRAFTGQAYISQKEIVYSEEEIRTCLASLDFAQSRKQIDAVCFCEHEEESAFLEEWNRRQDVQPSVPSRFDIKVLDGKCVLSNSTTFFGRKLEFYTSMRCPIGTSKKEFQAGIMELYSRYPKRYLSVFMSVPDAQAEPAMKLKALIPLDVDACLSSLAVSVDAAKQLQQLTCKVTRGRELDDLNQTRGVVNSMPVRLKTNLKGQINPDFNQISISLDSSSGDAHFIYIHYYDWDKKYPVVTDEVRKEFARVLSYEKFFIVEAAVRASVKTSFPKLPLPVSEIDLFDGHRE